MTTLIENTTERIIGCAYTTRDGSNNSIVRYAHIPPGTHRLPPGGLEALLDVPGNRQFFDGGAGDESAWLKIVDRVRQGDTHAATDIAMESLSRVVTAAKKK